MRVPGTSKLYSKPFFSVSHIISLPSTLSLSLGSQWCRVNELAWAFVFASVIDQQKTFPFDGATSPQHTCGARYLSLPFPSLFVICLLGVLTLST